MEANSTDETAYRWFKRAMEDRGYRVHKQTFNMIEIHLLAQMNIVGPHLGIMCDEGFEGHELCDFLTKGRGKDIEFIEITPEEVVAFGDSENDLEMFKAAGTSVAMGQADDRTKAAAEYVTARNDEAGVARAVEKILATGVPG